MTKERLVFNWSGGKDSALALYKLLQAGQYRIDYLLTTLNKEFQRVSMHGVRDSLLELQAESIGISLDKLWLPEHISMAEYNALMREKLDHYKDLGGYSMAFGDIFLEDLRTYREEKLREIGLKSLFPLWKQPTKTLMREFLDLGFKTIVTCVNEKFLDKSFVGRVIDDTFCKDLPKNVDICGENGEFHTFVFDGPIFKSPIPFKKGDLVYKVYHSEHADLKTGFWFCDLLPLEK